eukprot:m.199464 g.199464  ORF g.199464 m.199464 type:complete len:153 (+) comp13697_c2_seq2:1069-1527(+)
MWPVAPVLVFFAPVVGFFPLFGSSSLCLAALIAFARATGSVGSLLLFADPFFFLTTEVFFAVTADFGLAVVDVVFVLTFDVAAFAAVDVVFVLAFGVVVFDAVVFGVVVFDVVLTALFGLRTDVGDAFFFLSFCFNNVFRPSYDPTSTCFCV